MKPVRSTNPRRWGLSLASVTLAAMPAMAEAHRAISLPQPPSEIHPEARLWLTAGTEGGESGESGITAEASDDAAYLAELAILHGHYRAAGDLWDAGHKDLARDLAGHPEDEGTLATLAEKVIAKGLADPRPAIATYRAALAGEDAGEVVRALSDVTAEFHTDQAVEAAETRARFDAVVLVLKAAAVEYQGATEGGKVSDPMGWHEAQAFVVIARDELQTLSSIDLSAKAAPRALTALEAADEAFATPETAADPGILLGIAAKVELLASSVR